MNEILAIFFDSSPTTVWRKIKNKNFAYLFANKYLDENKIKEFMQNGEIKKYEIIKNFTTEELEHILSNQIENIEIKIFKKINKIKKINLKVLFIFLKYHHFNSEKNIEDNFIFFQKNYKTKLKIETSIFDDIILFSHHFKTAIRIFKTIFNENDFIDMFEKKEIFLEEIKKRIF